MSNVDNTITITKPIDKNAGTQNKFTCTECSQNGRAKCTAKLIFGDCNKFLLIIQSTINGNKYHLKYRTISIS